MAVIGMKNTVKLRARADCSSHSRADVAVRDVSVAIDEPIERGGTNAGLTPTDTVLTGCTNVIDHKCATKLGVDIGHLTISAVCESDRRGVTLAEEIEVPFETVTLKVFSDGSAGQVGLDRVAIETEKYSPLSKLFRAAGTKLQVTWQKDN